MQVDKRVLHELYLPHFRDCVEAGAGSVMSAYNRVNGSWCGEHAELLNSILKRCWGFKGFVVSDFIFGIHDGVAAVLAGQDLEMPFQMVFAGCLAEALAAGRLPHGRLDEAVLRLLQAQLAVPAGSYPATLRSCPAHLALAREAATQSIVLLRNEVPRHELPRHELQPVLPFRDLTSLALIGPLAALPNLGDRGSSDTRPSAESVVTPWRASARPIPSCASTTTTARIRRRQRPWPPARRRPWWWSASIGAWKASTSTRETSGRFWS